MTTFVGSEAILKVGGSPSVVGGTLMWSLEEEAETQEDTGLNDEWVTRLSGPKLRKSWSGSIKFKLDEAQANQSLFDVGELVAAEFFPAGETSAQEKISGSFVVRRKSTEASEDNSNMVYEIDFDGTGPLTKAAIA